MRSFVINHIGSRTRERRRGSMDGPTSVLAGWGWFMTLECERTSGFGQVACSRTLKICVYHRLLGLFLRDTTLFSQKVYP